MTVILASNQTSTKHNVWISMNVLRKMEAAENTNASIVMEAILANVTLVTSLIPSKQTAVFRKVALQNHKRERVCRKVSWLMGVYVCLSVTQGVSAW